MQTQTLLSVLVPVFHTEHLLRQCLDSFLPQTFQNFEIVICDDGSDGKDANKHNSHHIYKEFKKVCKKQRPDIKVRFVYHKNNLGILETRRTLVEEAATEILCFTDSDDTVLPNYLETLYNAHKESGADIVQAHAILLLNGKEVTAENRGINKKHLGTLEGKDILDGFIVKHLHSSYLIGKLVTRELMLQAFNQIPFLQCTMSDDLIIYIYMCFFAKKYYGLETPVYNYNITEGITSQAKITTLERWEKVCSAASLYTALFAFFQDHPEDFTELQQNIIKGQCRHSLKNSIQQLKQAVDPSLQEEAHEMLCQWWGEHFVESMEKELAQEKPVQNQNNPEQK